MPKLKLGPIHLLMAAYLLGVAGTLWDWHEHYLGISNQVPHLVIDVGGLLAIGVLAFSDWTRISQRTFVALYALLVVVVLIALGPFVLMMVAPHSQFMAFFMSSVMTRGALIVELPIVLLAAWAAWHWLKLAAVNAWRICAAFGVVVIAVASVWDLYWHQTHPLEMGASMNMMALPPHQLILAGFVLGLIGSGIGTFMSGRSPRSAPVEG
ncbi:MAG TPA: hypothetical protein VIR57_21200 [Chloroflexota bacterium]|jgi:hypothetical protein